MKQSNNFILNAVLSKLQSDKDEVYAKIDLIVNHKTININTNSVINDTVILFKDLNNLESTLNLVKTIIEQNESSAQIKEQINEISNLVSHLNESQSKTEINDNNT